MKMRRSMMRWSRASVAFGPADRKRHPLSTIIKVLADGIKAFPIELPDAARHKVGSSSCETQHPSAFADVGSRAREIGTVARPSNARPNLRTGFQALERGCHDGCKTGRRRQGGELGRVDPERLAEFVVEHRLAAEPAGGEGEDDEMALDPAVGVAADDVAVAGERDRLDPKA